MRRARGRCGEVGLIFGFSYFKCYFQHLFVLTLGCHPPIGRFYVDGNPSSPPTPLSDATDVLDARLTRSDESKYSMQLD